MARWSGRSWIRSGLAPCSKYAGNPQAKASDGLTEQSALSKIKQSSGSNSVVECDLAKVEVAGSNPVSRSRDSKTLASVRGFAMLEAAAIALRWVWNSPKRAR